ncbi:LLM class flavin-dependent oxidoreductase [Agromyces allii]|uniref:LLM class flavin-dependent oxidoreductase n=1 Tax=Agromyces allii TaxID=393607 RepID=A0ABP5CKW6_9MICO|nr:LLM class flavin-dependent oxidoreductase [Agromyces allii]
MTTLSTIAFLTPGNYDDARPEQGLEDTLALFEHGERLGYDGAWVRQRHLEHGVSSAPVFLAAASQRTSRIRLGIGVIPIGFESPFRLAEDLSTADVLSGGRLEVGVSAGRPPHVELIGERVFDGDWSGQDFSHARVDRLLENLSGEFIGDADTVIHSPGNVQRPRLQPHAAGLRDRVWIGAGSARSAEWAAERGLGLLTGNIVSGGPVVEGGPSAFAATQADVLARYRDAYRGAGSPRVALGRVIVPTDGADRATRAKYAEYRASREERTRIAHGERLTQFAPDLIGTAEEILEQLAADPVVSAATDLRLELPYEFSVEDYRQILDDVASLIAPELGWAGGGSRAGSATDAAARAAASGTGAVGTASATEAA